MTNLCWEGDLDTTLQDVVSGYLNRAGQLQVLHDQIWGHLREHLLDLMGLASSKERLRKYLDKNTRRENPERQSVFETNVWKYFQTFSNTYWLIDNVYRRYLQNILWPYKAEKTEHRRISISWRQQQSKSKFPTKNPHQTSKETNV